MFQIHKPGQAKASRTITFLGGLFLIAWGSDSLRVALSDLTFGSNARPLNRAWNEILMDAAPADAWSWDLVLFQSPFSPALTIALAVFVAASLWWFWFLNRPRIADHVVDMEAELQKVSWPTFSDAWQSTLVVSGFTALIVALVFLYDIVIKGVIDLMPVDRI